MALTITDQASRQSDWQRDVVAFELDKSQGCSSGLTPQLKHRAPTLQLASSQADVAEQAHCWLVHTIDSSSTRNDDVCRAVACFV